MATLPSCGCSRSWGPAWHCPAAPSHLLSPPSAGRCLVTLHPGPQLQPGALPALSEKELAGGTHAPQPTGLLARHPPRPPAPSTGPLIPLSLLVHLSPSCPSWKLEEEQVSLPTGAGWSPSLELEHVSWLVRDGPLPPEVSALPTPLRQLTGKWAHSTATTLATGAPIWSSTLGVHYQGPDLLRHPQDPWKRCPADQAVERGRVHTGTHTHTNRRGHTGAYAHNMHTGVHTSTQHAHGSTHNITRESHTHT